MIVIILVLVALGFFVYAESTGAGSNMTSGGQKLTAAEIAMYAANAGFSGDDLATAVAVALAESGGDPSVYNPETQANTPPDLGSYGLWQIYLNKHPEFSGQNLYDPQTNAAAAYSIYQKDYFGAWSTYNSGSYMAFLPAAQGAAGVYNG